VDLSTVNCVIVNKLLLKCTKYTGDCEEFFPFWKVKNWLSFNTNFWNHHSNSLHFSYLQPLGRSFLCVLYPSLYRPNICNFCDTNSANIELTSLTSWFIFASNDMYTYWRNTVYVLSVVKWKCLMGGARLPSWSNIYYLPDFAALLFAVWLISFFLSERLQLLYAVLISPPSDISVTPYQLVFHSIENPKLHLYLINNSTVMFCGGSVEVHRRTFSYFPSVAWVVSLARLLLCSWERTHHITFSVSSIP